MSKRSSVGTKQRMYGLILLSWCSFNTNVRTMFIHGGGRGGDSDKTEHL